jgi:hypothetical protein
MTLPPHLEVLDGFIRAAEQVPDDEWNRAQAGDGWSPAQVAEHLRLAYVVTRPELRGGKGFRVRTSRWKQWLFQFLFLRRITEQGRFPANVPAVREIRPAPGPYDRTALLAALRDEGEQFDREFIAVRDTNVRLSHPFLGRLNASDALALTTQHILHHQKQLARR